MADQATRAAARVAALIAVPIALAVGVLAFWGLGGLHAAPATGPVPVSAPSLDSRAALACQGLIAKLPDQIQGHKRRPVTTGGEQNAAYGDPAITLACGAPAPTVPMTATVYPLSGVCWYAVTGKNSSTWTTVDRAVPVRVTVPDHYDQPGQLVIEFSAPVAASEQAESGGVPSGCADPAQPGPTPSK